MGFFDRIAGSLNSAGENVVKMAKDASDISKYNSQIEEHKGRIRRIYTDIGKYFWENREKLETDDMLKQWILQIENETEKINAVEGELRQLRLQRGIEICKNCGAELKKNANFCNVCGAPVVRVSENIQMCGSCGAQLKGDEKFCMNCGAKIELMESVPERQETEPQKCVSCGQQLRPGDVFCRFCGTPVAQPSESEIISTSASAGEGQTEE